MHDKYEYHPVDKAMTSQKERQNKLVELPLEIKNSIDPLTLDTYSQDLWPRKLIELRDQGPLKEPTIDLVLWPETRKQVSEIAKWANKIECALYPYGAGSGVCGATIPNSKEERPRVLIDFKCMRKIRSINEKSMTVWAETGIIGENLERSLNQKGYTLGHFPSSIYCSSLGGYLATRSAGQFSTKYGKIEDMVLALEIVLPDGSTIETARAPRSAMGPDLTQLFLGTEGTLGFFTAACLQIHPAPEERTFQSFGAKSISQAIEFSRILMQKGLRPAALRIYDQLETSLTLNSEILQKSGFKGNCAIIAIFEGTKNLTKTEAQEAINISEKLEINYIGPDLAAHWWEHRYDVSYKQQLILNHKRMLLDTFEIAATWEHLETVYTKIKKINIGWGVILAHFSHFYHTGANIYFTLVSHAGLTKSSLEHYDEIWESLLKTAYESGATLSHHHGVGEQKNHWMRIEKAAWISVFEKVKYGFDPKNIFNPGKMGLQKNHKSYST